MRNPRKISGTVFLRSIQKTEYGLAKVTLDGQKKMIPFLLTGLGRDVVDGARFKGVLISQNCKGHSSNVITNIDVTRKPRATKKSSRTRGVKMAKRSLSGKDKGLVDEVNEEYFVVAQDITGTRYVCYQPGHWYVGENVDYTPTHNTDPVTGLLIAINASPA